MLSVINSLEPEQAGCGSKKPPTREATARHNRAGDFFSGCAEERREVRPPSQQPCRENGNTFTMGSSGMLYFGFRYYHPQWGRFLNRDPIQEAGGNNLYRFVSNDPVNRWDLLGLSDDNEQSDLPEQTKSPDPQSDIWTDGLKAGTVNKVESLSEVGKHGAPLAQKALENIGDKSSPAYDLAHRSLRVAENILRTPSGPLGREAGFLSYITADGENFSVNNRLLISEEGRASTDGVTLQITQSDFDDTLGDLPEGGRMVLFHADPFGMNPSLADMQAVTGAGNEDVNRHIMINIPVGRNIFQLGSPEGRGTWVEGPLSLINLK